MSGYPWNMGQELTYSDLNAAFTLAYSNDAAAIATAQQAITLAQQAQSTTLAGLTAILLALPTSLPATSGVLWLNGGVPCIS